MESHCIVWSKLHNNNNIYIHTYTYIYTHIHVYIYVFVCVYTCLYKALSAMQKLYWGQMKLGVLVCYRKNGVWEDGHVPDLGESPGQAAKWVSLAPHGKEFKSEP